MRYFLPFFLSISLFYACRKDEKITTDPSVKLEFSEDTVLFDTVFTSAGSTVASLQVYNRNDKKIVISSIQLAGGAHSQFRLNIDGVPGPSATNIEISGHDSLFIFVEVTVDPTNALSPFLVCDSVVFTTNGNVQDVKLVAYGQNAHYFHSDTRIPGYPAFSILPSVGNITHWINDKPYVIFDYAAVDSGNTLIIDPGVRVYFHKGGGLWVFAEGNIQVNGEKDKRVSFQGDRLESIYNELPGQWDRIWLNENTSKNSFINYAIIKNGFIGLQTEVLQTLSDSGLILNNSVIRNMSGLGIYSNAYNITATNTVISNCGQQLLGLTLGGKYNFTHCTLANYWNSSQRQDPSFVFTNYNSLQALDLDARFVNCILDGSEDEEFAYDLITTVKKGDYLFKNCMLKTQKNTSDANHYVSVFVNQDAAFSDKLNNDYRIKSNSYAIDRGITTIPLVDKDITEFMRTPPPDLGAYEFH